MAMYDILESAQRDAAASSTDQEIAAAEFLINLIPDAQKFVDGVLELLDESINNPGNERALLRIAIRLRGCCKRMTRKMDDAEEVLFDDQFRREIGWTRDQYKWEGINDSDDLIAFLGSLFYRGMRIDAYLNGESVEKEIDSLLFSIGMSATDVETLIKERGLSELFFDKFSDFTWKFAMEKKKQAASHTAPVIKLQK
jgi:hypothetical protein